MYSRWQLNTTAAAVSELLSVKWLPVACVHFLCQGRSPLWRCGLLFSATRERST